ncbi:MAG: type II secretion system ATPase GspE [Pseudomonadota bacterium]
MSAESIPKDIPTFNRLPFAYAKRHGVLIECVSRTATMVLCRMYPNPIVVAEIQRSTGRPVFLRELDSSTFERELNASYQGDSQTMHRVAEIGGEMDLASLADQITETEDLMEQEDDAPIVRLINAVLAEAVREQASDIHIEPFEKRLVIRMRTDGVLREIVEPRRELAPLLVSRIKVMAKLDIAEKRVPQDGRVSIRIAGRELDVRVSTMPSNNGERVVMRLLDKQAGRLNVDLLGMDPVLVTNLKSLLAKPHGILLVTGPTGSGKTTTLYAGLSYLNDQTRNILTVEDPIEYQLEGIGQTQVSPKVDMTFARGLRAILRQDPDVVMVGEIRDLETAEIAVQASLTGHLVLSTLHTNTAVGAVTRLHDMGIEPFLLSSSLLGVMAQRLVRVLCPHCKQEEPMTPSEMAELVVNPKQNPTVCRAHGCTECNQSGYRGRTGIYELVIIDSEMRELIHRQDSEAALERHARTLSASIRQDGVRKILAGITSIEEVLRVTREA